MNYFKGGLFGLVVLGTSMPVLAEEELSAEEVLSHCYYKYAGDDQRSYMSITIQAEDGKPMTSEYTRLWKNYEGDGDLVDKVVLFTETPPHNRGLAFMRWGYSYESKKIPDMWIYLPDLRKVRRISQRDPAAKAWVIKDEDLRLRGKGEDVLAYKGIQQKEGADYYVVEFTPKEDLAYSKRVAWFTKTDNWDDCVQHQVDFYDKSGELVKQQFIEWRKIDKAWAWKEVSIESTKSNASIVYEMQNIEVNVGLDDSVFTKPTMKRGYRP